MQETRVRSLSWEDPLEEEMALLPAAPPPPPYSCLEDPVDRGARRATISPWGREEADTT